MKRTIVSMLLAAVIAAPICGYAGETWYSEPDIPMAVPMVEPIPDTVDSLMEIRRQAEIAEAAALLDKKGCALPEDIRVICERVGSEYDIEPTILEALAWRESRYDRRAVSGTNKGLCQVSTYWHRDRMARLGVTDIFDAEQNVMVAADLLAELSGSYDSIERVLMAYNGDHRAVISAYANEVVEVAKALETVQKGQRTDGGRDTANDKTQW